MHENNLFLRIILILTIFFCFITVCTAEEKKQNYIETSISNNEKNIKLNIFINSTEEIYGLLGTINYDNSKLELIDCQSNNFDITIKNNIILAESAIGYKNKTLAQCNFNIKEVGLIELGTISNITLSNSNKVLNNTNLTLDFNNQSDEEILDSPDEGIINPPTGNSSYILTIIILIISIIILFIIEKKHKIFLIILSLSIYPISILAMDTNLNITKEQLSQIRNILLSTNENNANNQYDYDQDNKLTVNDLIISLIDYKSPDIIFDSEILKGTSEYNTEATRIIKIESIDKITNVSYCITENKNCNPDTDYKYNNDNVVKIKFNDNKKEQKVCIKVKNELHLERTICDTKSYKVDSITPKISVKQQTISIGEDTTYDPKNNVVVTYGESGGKLNCNGNITIGTNTIKCTATGNNGLTNEINFTVIVNKSKENVYFLDTISMTETTSDAILIESNGKFGMIDTGYDDTDGKAETKILKFLQEELKIETLDFVIITHGHTDHVGLYDEISDAIKIKKLYIKQSGYNFSNRYKQVIDKANSDGTTIINVEENSSSFKLGDIEFKFYNTAFVNKDQMTDTKADNANSIATLANVHGKKIYFSGDIGMYGKFGNNLDTEVKTAKEIGTVDVYKAAHHGYISYQNGTEALSHLKPTYVIFTNTSTHTSPKEVVNRIKSITTNYKKSYYTADGTLTMNIADNGELTFSQ